MSSCQSLNYEYKWNWAQDSHQKLLCTKTISYVWLLDLQYTEYINPNILIVEDNNKNNRNRIKMKQFLFITQLVELVQY